MWSLEMKNAWNEAYKFQPGGSGIKQEMKPAA